jgi:hypothetical protein
MEFKSVFKTGVRTKIRQRVPEIYYFCRRKPHKLEILNVCKITLFLYFLIITFKF